jgi:hypothetical protein
MPHAWASLCSRQFDERMKIFCFLWKKQKNSPIITPSQALLVIDWMQIKIFLTFVKKS